MFTGTDCNADKLLSTVLGDFGKWQCWISIYMALLKLPLAWYQLNIIFMAPPQDFWCAKPYFFSQYSEIEWRDICAPKNQEHPCMIYDPDILFIKPDMDRSLIPLVECPKFVYDTTTFNRTLTSDFDLVCSKHWLIHLTQCVMMWGVLVGGILFGVVADQFGRKIPLMVGITMQCVTGFAASVLPSYWIFLINWCLLAIASGGIGIISFVISMEIVSGKYRTTIPVVYQLPFGLGNTVMAIFAYWFRDWRKLEFALATLSSLYMLYWFVLSETPRWLLATRQNEKALKVIGLAAKQNNREKYFEQVLQTLSDCKSRKSIVPGFMSFVRSRSMRLKTFLLSINWFCTGLSFYTFSQYLGLIGNIFLTVAISGIISVFGGVFCLFIATKVGRKTSVWIFQTITAFCFIFIICVPKDRYVIDWPRLLFAGLGFAGLSGTVPALYLFTGELFPTVGRNVGVAGVTIFARIASMVAPVVVSLNDVKPDLPLVLLGIMSFCQLALLIPLPETKDKPLLDTLEETELKIKEVNKR